jgi:hypothetical protein
MRNDKAQAETIPSLALPAALLLTVDARHAITAHSRARIKIKLCRMIILICQVSHRILMLDGAIVTFTTLNHFESRAIDATQFPA